MTKTIIFSSTVFKKEAKKEIQSLFKDCTFEDLFEGVFILENDLDKVDTLRHFKENEPIFVHNALPVDFSLDSVDTKEMTRGILEGKLLDKEKPFSIETLTYKTETKSRDIEVGVGSGLEENGYTADRKNLSQLIGVLVYDKKVYLGTSDVKSLIYPYIDLAKRFSRESMSNSRLNRAQFKIIEAIERFGIKHARGNKYALDLGAAPGGWSKVLVDNGYEVIAIDKGALDESIKGNPHILHIQQTINDANIEEINEAIKKRLDGKNLDMITNDMNIDYSISLGVINRFSEHLTSGGKVIMTLKSMRRNIRPAIDDMLSLMGGKYDLIKAKHLDQNRQEITFYFSKK